MVDTPDLWKRSVLYLLTWSDFDRAVRKIATGVRDESPPVDCIVGIARGGLVPAVALSNVLDVEDLRIVSVARNVGSGQYLEKRRPTVRWLFDPQEMRDKRVLVVDDVAGSGETLAEVRAEIDEVGPERCRTAVLVRMLRGTSAPDLAAVELDDWVVFPWEDRDLEPDTRTARVVVRAGGGDAT